MKNRPNKFTTPERTPVKHNTLKNFFKYGPALIFIMISGCKESSTFQSLADFNFDWEFALQQGTKEDPSFLQKAQWDTVNLPHDWSVKFPFDSIYGEGATGYLPGGIGWYKKKFSYTKVSDQTTYILFDGVYNNSEVWLNDKKLGDHPYGYSPFYFDITSSLKEGTADNQIKVKVDHSRYADSRWYTGSGIYRNVKLITKNKLHIPIWGTYITTPSITEESGEVALEVTVRNNFGTDQSFTIKVSIKDQKGNLVSEKTMDGNEVSKEEKRYTLRTEVPRPILWNTEHPYLYTAVTQIMKNGTVVDETIDKFGIRTIVFDTVKGFFLNGENMKIKGVCLHHDGGLVGAAVPKDVWKRRLKKLKEAGCNAIRTSHNPPSQEFLDLCDAMGFMVQDEFFDEWDNPKDKRHNMNERSVDYITRGYAEHFQEWAEKDLKNTVRAHRNHPSIIQWSIGNEIEWTYPRNAKATGFFNNMDWSGNYFWSQPPYSPEQIKENLDTLPRGKYDIGQTAKKLAKWTKELDTTRYVIANCILPSASYLSGYIDALDMVGYSYRRVIYDYGHQYYPNKSIMGTENLGQWHEWKAVMERPFISGLFLWTGIDYMGESNKGWPKKGTASGLLDMAGFEKPSYHMFKSLWNPAPSIYMATQTADKSVYRVDGDRKVVEKKPGSWEHALWFWHDVNESWNYDKKENTIVEIYSNCPEVELFLNGKSLGIKKLSYFPDHIYKWGVPFTPGVLLAKGNTGKETVSTKLITAGNPVGVKLSTDKNTLAPDGYNVAHIVAQLIDDKGNPVKNTDREITFSMRGDAKILGVDNGAITNVQDYQSNKIRTSQGRALLLIQSERRTSNIEITAHVEGLKGDSVNLTSSKPNL